MFQLSSWLFHPPLLGGSLTLLWQICHWICHFSSSSKPSSSRHIATQYLSINSHIYYLYQPIQYSHKTHNFVYVSHQKKCLFSVPFSESYIISSFGLGQCSIGSLSLSLSVCLSVCVRVSYLEVFTVEKHSLRYQSLCDGSF